MEGQSVGRALEPLRGIGALDGSFHQQTPALTIRPPPPPPGPSGPRHARSHLLPVPGGESKSHSEC